MRRTALRIADRWRNMKGWVGLGIISSMLVGAGMQVQAMIDSRERAQLRASCESRVLAVRDEFTERADERDGVVDEVGNLVAQTLTIQRETLALMRKRAPVTDGIARRVEALDGKATAAATDARAAKLAAQQAAQATTGKR